MLSVGTQMAWPGFHTHRHIYTGTDDPGPAGVLGCLDSVTAQSGPNRAKGESSMERNCQKRRNTTRKTCNINPKYHSLYVMLFS